MSSILKNIIVVLGLAALAGVGYYLFVLNKDATISTATSGTAVSAEVETQTILRRLEDLQTITISTEVLRSPKFQSLRNFGSVVDQVQVGRDEPFRKP